MKKVLRLGTRGSKLALTQSRQVMRALAKANPGLGFELTIIKTKGDAANPKLLFGKGNVGIFTKELEKNLLLKRVDIAVHSLKDLPTRISAGLMIAAYPERVNNADVLLSRHRYTLKTLPHGAVVGTGSPRRKRQLQLFRPDLKLVDIQGNLDTRAKKVLVEKKMDAIVVALAGLKRIRQFKKYYRIIPARQMLPAPGQGALAIEIRQKDVQTLRVVQKLDHSKTRRRVTAERVFLKVLEGGCRVPAGIHSHIIGGRLMLDAGVFSPDSADFLREGVVGPSKHPEKLGKEIALRLLKKGAGKFLRASRLKETSLDR